MKKSKRERLTKQSQMVSMLSEGNKTREDIQRELGIPKSNFYDWKKSINKLNTDEGRELLQQALKKPQVVKPFINEGIQQLLTIEEFEAISLIRDYKNDCRLNRSPDYTNYIFRVCNASQTLPEKLSASLESAKNTYMDFESKFLGRNPNQTTENYRKGIRSFLRYTNVRIPSRDKILSSATDSKGDYARVYLTVPEVKEVAKIVGQEVGFEYKTLFLLHHEIFARPTTLHEWKPNVDIKTAEIDGQEYEYGEADVFEKKQKKHYTKIIMEPMALRMAKTYKDRIVKDSLSTYERKYSKGLKTAYESIGKIDRNDYEKGEEGWLYYNRPIYTIRHSAAVHWLHRTAFDSSMVANMGWEKVDTLNQFYARSTSSDMMQKGVCYYCNPPKTLSDLPLFCTPMHALAHLNGGKKN